MMGLQSDVRVRHSSRWKHAATRYLDPNTGVPAVVKSREALADWDKLRGAPSGRARDEMRMALELAIAHFDHALVQTCLNRTAEVVSAAAGDDRWNTRWSATRRIEQGDLESTAALAIAWAHNSAPSAAALVSASRNILEGAIEERPIWSELAQSEYIHAIQLLMIAGEENSTAENLKVGKDFHCVKRHYAWHKQLLGLLASNDITAAQYHFDPYFDEIRDPFFKPPANDPNGNNLLGVPLLRLRLALIRWIYIERQPIAGNWRHIIGQIGY
jgi:hypothetical protein